MMAAVPAAALGGGPGLPLAGVPNKDDDGAKCPRVPAAPPGVSVNDNIRRARLNRLNPARQLWFFGQVANGGPWDYKQEGAAYQAFGNVSVYNLPKARTRGYQCQ